MKQITTLMILVATTLTGIVHAQDVVPGYREKLTFGLKAGLNYSNVYDSKGEQFNADPRFGFAGGAFVGIPIGKFLGIQPEVLFSQKGFRATGTVLGSPYELNRVTDYLDIPVFLVLKPVDFVSIMAGPQFSYLMKQTDSFGNSTNSSAQQQEFNNDNIRKNTVCFVGGADITLNHFVVSGRVGWDLFENNGDGTTTTPRYKNVWGQATVGFRF